MLQILSEREPILIAVDDVQWLDPSSSSALAFALRRLDENQVLVLLTRRLVDGAQPSELEQALGAECVQRLPVGPLSVGALHRILRDRVDRPFARQTLLRIHEKSGGNPFFALELARVLDVDVEPLRRSRFPRRSKSSCARGSPDFPASTREALALASALGHSLGVVAGAGGCCSGSARAGDRRARDRARERDDPLHPSAAVVGPLLGPRARSGGASTDGSRASSRIRSLRARHLALSSDTPNADVAAVLDDATKLAADRAASAVAAELAEQALRLTPPDEGGERHRRALAAARAHQAAGEWTRAQAIATDLLAEVEVGSLRAEALVLLAELESLDRGPALLEAALREARREPGVAVDDPLSPRLGETLQGRVRARPCSAGARRGARRRHAPSARPRGPSHPRLVRRRRRSVG